MENKNADIGSPFDFPGFLGYVVGYVLIFPNCGHVKHTAKAVFGHVVGSRFCW
jgi:ammonia channel protein AmtB